MSKTALISHQDCVRHEMSAGHPERPARIAAVLDELAAQGLSQKLEHFKAPEATRDQLLLAHPSGYIDDLMAKSPAEGSVQLDADTAMNEYSIRAALLAAGSGIKAVDLVIDDSIDNAFCCVRPPGHHAERAEAMGFCFFASVAIAALYALQKEGIEKVAIIDFDVHHGNGTEDILGDRADVFFCSTFQHPLYPGKFGANDGGRKINLPLPGGADGSVFKREMEQHCFPALRAFSPDLIILSAGFDAHRDDMLGGLNFLEADYDWVTRELKSMAAECCQGRVVSMLEGGYDLPALGRSAAAHVKVLLD
ncbi:deacetylase [Chromatiales bacterium (ex Bugula neritina AB1)]|nr:deacetylase [Chromatiales bacterium (ex Bugula neritina AB1)]